MDTRHDRSPGAVGSVRAGSRTELEQKGQLLTKLGPLPVVVFADDGELFAIEDRCPHMGFPLHRGTVECGLVTCHWHHARFDLASGGTLDPWADDTRAFDVVVDGDDVYVEARTDNEIARLHQRLREGLEDNLTLVIAKSVLGLLEHGEAPQAILRTALDFGTRYRSDGWGAGLTVLVAMTNVLPLLDEEDRGVALVHALRFVARDTAGRAPRFPVAPLPGDALPVERVEQWYRRFIDTRSGDSAERALRTLVDQGTALDAVERVMMAAVSDHVFIDEGHTLDFTNKAFEALAAVGGDDGKSGIVLTSLVGGTAMADRSEEGSEWQYPHDLLALVARASAELAGEPHGRGRANGSARPDAGELAWQLLGDDPEAVVDALLAAFHAGLSDEELGRAVAYAAALRITRFHTQNDHADWNTVHHSFTTANALHHSLSRAAAPATRRALVHSALRVYLDRFLNIPAARLPSATTGDLDALTRCFEVQGEVDTAGNLAFGYVKGGGSRGALVAALGHALLHEDAEFHWYQVFEAAVRQSGSWPEGSDQSALILAGFARFLAAHTPTRRELPNVIRIASRLRRGEALFEEE
jgi:nitrite reductase/ring-hydroxylating ferredoxin subunit